MDQTNVIASGLKIVAISTYMMQNWYFSIFCHLLLNFLSCLFYDTLKDP